MKMERTRVWTRCMQSFRRSRTQKQAGNDWSAAGGSGSGRKLAQSGGLKRFKALFHGSDLNRELVDPGVQLHRAIFAIAVLPGDVAQRRIGIANLPFPAPVESQRGRNQLLVENRDLQSTISIGLFGHDFTRGKSQLLFL